MRSILAFLKILPTDEIPKIYFNKIRQPKT